jgi:N-terminal acetyltransferase B complex non-catalytic subunit
VTVALHCGTTDFIDAANYKKALQEVEKVLKKQKDFLCAKVLKALALLRLGREAESASLLQEVYNQSPGDDATLQAMTICYREMGRPELVTSCYEKALAKDPANEELASHLFMSYVRTNDVQKQQLVALNLYKLKPKNPYYFWHVMSLYLQAINDPDAGKRKLLLTLAEKKVEKMVNEKKIEAEAEVELFLMILEKEEKYDQMIQVIDGPLGNRFLPNHIDFVNRRKAFLFLKMGSTRRAFDAFKCLLDSNPDQMEYYRNYISAAFTLDQELDGHKKHIGMVIDFIKKLTEKSSKKGRLRGPHLAKIELYFQLMQREETDSSYKDMKSLLFKRPTDGFVDLFNYFGHKNPFYSDVCYIHNRYPAHCPAVVKQLPHLFSSHATFTSQPSDMDHMKWCSVVHYLQELSGMSKPDSETISKLMSLYHSCLPLGHGLLPSEINPSDDFALLAAHILTDKQTDESRITQAVLILEQAIKRSPANHTMKLLLIMLYNNLGCVSMSFKLFESLETKYIQVDTLHYIIHSSLIACGDYASALTLLTYAAKFYLSSCKDTNDFTISCYRYGSFTKIEEITQMRDDLRNSLHFLSFSIDKCLLQIAGKAEDAMPDVIKCLTDLRIDNVTDGRVDNRDIRVFCNTPLGLQDKLIHWKDWSRKCDIQWYHYRSLVLRAVNAAYGLLHDSDASQHPVAEKKAPNGICDTSNLQDILKEMQSLSLQVPLKHESLTNETITGPHTPRIVSFLSNEWNMKQVIAILETVCSFVTWSGMKENKFTFSNAITDSLNKSVDQILSLKKTKSLQDAKSFLEAVAHQTEILSLTCLMLSFISSNLKKKESVVVNKGKKKDKDPVTESPETLQLFHLMILQIMSTCERFIDAIGAIQIDRFPDPMAEVVLDFELFNADVS